METNTAPPPSEDNQNSPSEDNQNSPSGESPLNQRITELTTSLSNAKTAFTETSKDLITQIGFWTFICFAIVVFCFCVFNFFFDKQFKELNQLYWTWQYIYFTAIRITAISAIFYVATFSFNMLKSVIYLYQKNKSKIAIIDSMASFVEAGIEKSDRTLIFNKLIGIVVETDILPNEKQEQNGLKINSQVLVEILEKVLKASEKK